VEDSHLSVEEVCRLLGVHKSTFYRQKAKQAASCSGERKRPKQTKIREKVISLCEQHPTYGYRRIWALLKRQGIEVNQKTVYSVMKAEGLAQKQKRYEAKRTYQPVDFQINSSNQVWHIDMTKIWTEQGWKYLVSIIDAHDRRIVAWSLDEYCRDDEAIAVVEQAVIAAFPYGVRGKGLKLVQDNGSQFTSRDFVSTLKTLEIEQIRTSYKHPQSNGKMERWYRTLKEEEVWANEYRTLEEARVSIGAFIERYNNERPHSALGYQTPMEVYLGKLYTKVA
jgi:putative transposase